jgi:hypothetical protein
VRPAHHLVLGVSYFLNGLEAHLQQFVCPCVCNVSARDPNYVQCEPCEHKPSGLQKVCVAHFELHAKIGNKSGPGGYGPTQISVTRNSPGHTLTFSSLLVCRAHDAAQSCAAGLAIFLAYAAFCPALLSCCTQRRGFEYNAFLAGKCCMHNEQDPV